MTAGYYDKDMLNEVRRERRDTNARLEALIAEQQYTNRLLVMLMQGLNIPDPTRADSAEQQNPYTGQG